MVELKEILHEDMHFGGYAGEPYEDDGDIIVPYTDRNGEDIGYFNYTTEEYHRW